MIRSIPVLAFTLLFLIACSTSKPPAVAIVEPVPDPIAIGIAEGAIEVEAAVETGLRIGRVAGVLAAVFGGPDTESIEDAIDRYRRVRDAAVVTAVIVGAAKHAAGQMEQASELDIEAAALQGLEFLEVARPSPDRIEVRFLTDPTGESLAEVAEVLGEREGRIIDIEGPGMLAFDVRDSLIDLGIPAPSLNAHRKDRLAGVILHIREGS